MKMSSRTSSFKGFLPSITFAMAKKTKVTPALLFVGDQAAFDGDGGMLFNKMIEAMGKTRSSVSLLDFEKASLETIQGLSPKVIVVLGVSRASKFLNQKEHLRGKVHEVKDLKWVVSYHPVELLKETALKKEAWEDLKLALKALESHVR